MKIRTVIVDDERHGRENLAGIVRDYCPEVELLGDAASVEAAKTLIRKFDPDLVFLDIEMPRANGFELLNELKDFRFEVIFVTAYGNYAIRAIRFSAADYILKPINGNDLKKAVEKVSDRIRRNQENLRMRQLVYNLNQPAHPRIGLPAADRIEFVEVQQIIRCRGEGNYTHVYLEGEKHLLVAKTLVEFEDLLQEHRFIRVHKTHLVNILHIIAYVKTGGGYLQLSSGDSVPVSRRRKEAVHHVLKMNVK